MWPFLGLVVAHATVGAVGLILFWVVVLSRKGGPLHRRAGRWFAWSMIVTGAIAVGISINTLLAPLATHPDFTDSQLVRGLFGWMMLYLAVLTVALGWQAQATIANKAAHERNRSPFDIALQLALLAVSANCLWHGLELAQPIMIAIPLIGLISAPMALAFAFWPAPPRFAYLLEHVRAGVGAGISGYTAFLSVGLVRAFPEHAFNPLVWAVPGVFGLALILWHQVRIIRSARPARPRSGVEARGAGA
jgi:hypothetical protein